MVKIKLINKYFLIYNKFLMNTYPIKSGYNKQGNKYYIYNDGQYEYDNDDGSYYSHFKDNCDYNNYVNTYYSKYNTYKINFENETQNLNNKYRRNKYRSIKRNNN